MKVKGGSAVRGGNVVMSGEHHRPIWIFLKDLSKSMYAGTRKMVNYGCAG